MDLKSCSKSQGQPPLGSRSFAITAISFSMGWRSFLAMCDYFHCAMGPMRASSDSISPFSFSSSHFRSSTGIVVFWASGLSPPKMIFLKPSDFAMLMMKYKRYCRRKSAVCCARRAINPELEYVVALNRPDISSDGGVYLRFRAAHVSCTYLFWLCSRSSWNRM